MAKVETPKTVTCRDINGKEVQVAVADLTFRPSAYGVLIEAGQALLSKQWDGFDLPGGALEITETIESALKREFFEETGLLIEVGNILHAASSFFFLPYRMKPCNSVLLYFSVRRIGGELSTANFDEDEVKYAGPPEWIDLDKLDELKFYSAINVPEIIRRAAVGANTRSFSLKEPSS